MTDQEKKTVEIDESTLEFIKSKADDMDKFKAKSKELENLIKDLQEKLPAGKEKPVKDQLLELLKEKDDTKTENQLINDKLVGFSQTIEQLQADLKAKDEKLTLREKQIAAEKIAQKYNFIDIDDVMAKVDLTKDNIDEQIKDIAETKKHWIKTQSAGNSFAGQGGEAIQTLQDKQKEALKKGDIATSIALKLKLAEK